MKVAGLFINTANENCSIHESGRMIFDCLSMSNAYSLKYCSLDMIQIQEFIKSGKMLLRDGLDLGNKYLLSDNYEFYVFNWHFITMASLIPIECLNKIRKPKFSIILELVSGDPLAYIEKDVFDAYLAIDPTTTRQGKIYPFPRPLNGSARRSCISNSIPIISSFGFATPGKGFERVISAVNREFDKALVRINIPRSPYTDSFSSLHNEDYAQYISRSCKNIAKPGIDVLFTQEFFTQNELINWCAESDLNCFMYTRRQAGLAATTDQSIIAGRPLLTNTNETFRHIHRYIKPYPLLSLRQAIDQTSKSVLQMQNDWSQEAFSKRFEALLADFRIINSKNNHEIGSYFTHQRSEYKKESILFVEVASNSIYDHLYFQKIVSAFQQNHFFNTMSVFTDSNTDIQKQLSAYDSSFLVLYLNNQNPEQIFAQFSSWPSSKIVILEHINEGVLQAANAAGFSVLPAPPIIPFYTANKGLRPGPPTIRIIGFDNYNSKLEIVLSRIYAELDRANVFIQQSLNCKHIIDDTQSNIALSGKNIDLFEFQILDNQEELLDMFSQDSMIVVGNDDSNQTLNRYLTSLALATERTVAFIKADTMPCFSTSCVYFEDYPIQKLIDLSISANINIVTSYEEGAFVKNICQLLKMKAVGSSSSENAICDISDRLSANVDTIMDPQTEHIFLNTDNALPFEKIIELDDDQFIDATFSSILKRSPTGDERRRFLNELHSGTSKYQLISKLILSKEYELHLLIAPSSNCITEANKLEALIDDDHTLEKSEHQSPLLTPISTLGLNDSKIYIHSADRGILYFAFSDATEFQNIELNAIALLHGLRDTGHKIFFITWEVELSRYRLLTKEEISIAKHREFLSFFISCQPAQNDSTYYLEKNSASYLDVILFLDNNIKDPNYNNRYVDMIFEAKRLGGSVVSIINEFIYIRETQARLSDFDNISEYLQSRLLCDFLITTSNFAKNDIMSLFYYHLKAERCPPVYNIDFPHEYYSSHYCDTSAQAFSISNMIKKFKINPLNIKQILILEQINGLELDDHIEFRQKLKAALISIGIDVYSVNFDERICDASIISDSGDSRVVLSDFDFIIIGNLIKNRTRGFLINHTKNIGIKTIFVERNITDDWHESCCDYDLSIITCQKDYDSLIKFYLGTRKKIVCPFEKTLLFSENLDSPFNVSVDSYLELSIFVIKSLIVTSPELAAERIDLDGVLTLNKSYFSNYHRPKLSLCISTYNRADWLKVNLQNIFKQIDLPRRDLEILVVDNCSNDHTPAIANEYLCRSDFTFIRNKRNVGMLGNLKITAHRSRGEYIWIIGDDDLTCENTIENILALLHTRNDLALIYLNYGYSSESNPHTIHDYSSYLKNFSHLEPATEDEFGNVSNLAAKSENFFTAIYSHIYRRDHGLRAYSQVTTDRPFSNLLSCVPTANYVLKHMMNEKGYWIGRPSLVVNSNVSWSKYGTLFDLEHLPHTWDLAEIGGCPAVEVDARRSNRLWLVKEMWREMFEADLHGNSSYFSAPRVLMRLKHLDNYDSLAFELKSIYTRAYKERHPAAFLNPSTLFSAPIFWGPLTILGNDQRLKTSFGHVHARSLHISTPPGGSCIAIFGPYIELPAGYYTITFHYRSKIELNVAIKLLSEQKIIAGPFENSVSIDFHSESNLRDFEFHFIVNGASNFVFDEINIEMLFF